MPTVRLTCSKCGQSFNYDYVPGGSVSAIRLGSSRYMACPLCGKYSTFPIRAARKEGSSVPRSSPRYSDSRLLARRLPWLVAPVVVALLALLWVVNAPLVVFGIEIACAIAFVLIAIVVVFTSRRPPLVTPPNSGP